MNKVVGYFYKTIGTVIDYTLQGLIYIFTVLVNVFSSIKQLFGLLFSAAGCLVFFFILNPFILATIIRSPIFWVGVLSLIVPIIGTIAVSYLKYIHYMATEYFYDKADFHILGRTAAYKRMEDYGAKYRENLERERLKKEQERRKRQEEEFRRQFGDFGTGGNQWGSWTFGSFEDFEQFFGQAQSGGYYNGYGQQGSYQNQSYQAPNSFKNQYEAACDMLGVPYTADKYEIKLSYRKMAKLYHPDLNKAEDAAEKFKQINNAYEFLSDDNILRYKNLH